MIRGTTAQFKFNLPYNFSDIRLAKITFWQSGNCGPATDRPLPIVKTLNQCSSSNIPNELCVTLTQEETLRFSDKTKAYVQLRAESIDGNAFASKQEQLTVYPVYDDSILDGIITPTPSDNGYIILDGKPIIEVGDT